MGRVRSAPLAFHKLSARGQKARSSRWVPQDQLYGGLLSVFFQLPEEVTGSWAKSSHELWDEEIPNSRKNVAPWLCCVGCPSPVLHVHVFLTYSARPEEKNSDASLDAGQFLQLQNHPAVIGSYEMSLYRNCRKPTKMMVLAINDLHSGNSTSSFSSKSCSAVCQVDMRPPASRLIGRWPVAMQVLANRGAF